MGHSDLHTEKVVKVRNIHGDDDGGAEEIQIGNNNGVIDLFSKLGGT